MHELALALGMVGGLASYELLGLSPGGIVTPGYIALFIDQPVRILGTLIVSLLTFAAVRLASTFTILFGRRRFVVTMLASFLLGWAWDALIVRMPVAAAELRVIGFIVPGLVANDFERQGITGTVSALAIVASLVGLVLLVAAPMLAGR